MKHIGIVGVSAEGAALCYSTIVQESAKILGEFRHPEISLNNISFQTIVEAQRQKDWHKVGEILLLSIKKLAQIGADFAIIPANSVHYSYDFLAKNSPIPIISIVDVVVEECQKRGYKKVGVLGIGLTMSEGLYGKPLQKAEIEVVIPSAEQQQILNTLIYQEIIPKKVTANTIDKAVAVVQSLKKRGCDAVILGCTELPIVIVEENSPLPFVDTTRLLAKKALKLALQ